MKREIAMISELFKTYLVFALVPTVGFLLSTLSIPYFKNWWHVRFDKK